MKIRIFISLFIFLSGCLISCNNNNSVVHPPVKTENNTSATGANKIAEAKKQKLSSVLYELAISQDSEYFAKKHHIFLDKGRVRVFISFDPSSSDQEIKKVFKDHNIIIEKSSADLTRGLVPIDHLIPLSEEPVIRSIRLPDRLIKARKISP